MFGPQVQIVVSFIILLDGLIVIGGGYLAAWLRRVWAGYLWEADPYALVGIILFLMFVNSFAMGRMKLYSDKRPASFVVVAYRIGVAVMIDFALLFIALFSLKYDDIGRLFLLFYSAILFAAFLVERWFLDIYMERRMSQGFNRRQVLLVGADARAASVLEALQKQRSWGHEVVGCLRASERQKNECPGVPDLGSAADFRSVIHEHSVDEVVFVLPREGNLGSFLEECRRIGLSYRVVPAMYEPEASTPMHVEHIQDIPTMTWNMVRINATGLLYKTVLDYVAGVVGFFLLAMAYPFRSGRVV